MRIVTIALILIPYSGFGWEHEAWLDQVQNSIDQTSIDWLRGKMKEGLPEIEQIDLTKMTKDQCRDCFSGGLWEMEPKIYVFMSFSIPDETWLNLSLELEKYAGIFVLRGFPNNSFQEFSRRLANLKKKGMSAAVQIDPKLFVQFRIEHVPTFIFSDSASFDKISGNVSLTYALERISYNGEQ